MSTLSDSRKPTLLAGLGNPLMTDEGIGVCIVEDIARRGLLEESVEVMELGTGNMNVIHAIADRRKVIFVDCARMGSEPGTMRRFGFDEVVTKKVQSNWSAHDGDLLNLLEISRTIGELPDDVVLFGIEPERIEYGERLTPRLQAGLEQYIAEIVEYTNR